MRSTLSLVLLAPSLVHTKLQQRNYSSERDHPISQDVLSINLVILWGDSGRPHHHTEISVNTMNFCHNAEAS